MKRSQYLYMLTPEGTCPAARRRSFTSIRLGLLSLLTLGASQAAIFNIADGDVAGLIAAIKTANANGETNVINLAPNGSYTLTAVADDGSGFYCCGPSGLPFVRSVLTINGNGATILRSSAAGTPPFGIIRVAHDPGPVPSTTSNLTLDGVTLTGANGAVVGVWQSTALIRNTTITNNAGQGILTWGSNLTILNSTISYNTGNNGYGGGGILHFGGDATATVISFSTIFENQNGGVGDAIATAFADSGSVTVKNSILASPTRALGPVCWVNGPGAVVSLGHNIAGDATCGPGGNAAPNGLIGPGDMNSTNPLLGPTLNNGGPTPTNFPAANSPAIGGVPVGYCTDASGNPVTTDQRGFPRPCPSTIGSVEFAGLYHVCLLYDSTKAVQSGATYPIKLQLCDGSGNDLSSSGITLHATSVTQVSTSISGTVQASGNANPDNDFRFDSTLGPTGGYIFNLSTKGLFTGTYNLNFTVSGDSFRYVTPFQVK
ncbi:MAG: right-handed parallel beta-helix repeat-containing protein [Acidobacteria bacterium]|nr:right-handed parallel beta-helix repeat-containing protein [Acidobacteriota bacterium]